MTIKNIADWAWSTQSIDEFWDAYLSPLIKSAQEIAVYKLQESRLKEYLKLKVKYGVGKPIIMTIHKVNGRSITYDIRDFETYVKYVENNKP